MSIKLIVVTLAFAFAGTTLAADPIAKQPPRKSLAGTRTPG
jgi:hypothetical protein